MEKDRKLNAEMPIGVFDSGIGGLTVAREIMRQMPKEKIVYFGDTARVPYGSKSRETVTRYSRQIVRFLLEQNVKAIVIACNTASAPGDRSDPPGGQDSRLQHQERPDRCYRHQGHCPERYIYGVYPADHA